MNYLQNFLAKRYAGKLILLLFLVANAIYIYMLFVSIPHVMTFSKGMDLLDMMPTGYDMPYVYALLETLGASGRQAYLYEQIPFDMVYPFLFGLSYCLVLGFFLNKLQALSSPWVYLCWLPIIAGLADYGENFGIVYLLNKYPSRLETAVALTNYFSIIKSITTTVYFFVLLVVLVVLGGRFVRRKAVNG